MKLDLSSVRFLSSERPPVRGPSTKKKSSLNRMGLDVRIVDGIGVVVIIDGFAQVGLPFGSEICLANDSFKVASDEEIKSSWLIHFIN
jgi:hypothetical protein